MSANYHEVELRVERYMGSVTPTPEQWRRCHDPVRRTARAAVRLAIYRMRARMRRDGMQPVSDTAILVDSDSIRIRGSVVAMCRCVCWPEPLDIQVPDHIGYYTMVVED